MVRSGSAAAPSRASTDRWSCSVDPRTETLTRAWRSFDRFEGRASLRTWLYGIASNVCFDLLKARRRRAQPMDMAGPSTSDGTSTAVAAVARVLLFPAAVVRSDRREE